ncbi:sulfate transport protein CysZ [Salinisphaera dokdonensis CL-ES53]|uniref:Sulfate transport protein CysZ n=1 Tax=Salinisphaera dokdonensis CL-ES53 TaxID=1304272 RepID=A0ABV2AW14_9GAMM
MNPISEFSAGPTYLLRGFAMLREPALRRYVVIPIAINIVLIALIVSLFGWQLDSWLNAWLSGLPDWLSWLETVLWWIGVVLSTLAFCYIFTLLANLIASPFNGLLSAQVEKLVTGTAPESGMGLAREMADGLFGELRRLRYYLTRALMLAVVSIALLFVPPANLAIAPLWFIFGAFMLSFEYLDQPMANRGLRFDDKILRLRARRWRHLGFGSLVTVMTAIPLANLVVMPAAVVGATLLYLECHPRQAISER